MNSPGDAEALAPHADKPAAEALARSSAPETPVVAPLEKPPPASDDLPLKEILPHPDAPPPPTETARPSAVKPLGEVPFPEASPDEAPPISRSACTLLGLKLFAAGAAVPILAAVAMPYLQFKGAVRLNWQNVGLALYLVVPPAALLGAAMGFEAYRLVCRSRRPMEISGWLWALFFILALPYGGTFWLAVPIYLHSSLRRDVLTPAGSADMKTSLLHFAYLIAWPVLVLTGMASLATSFQSSGAHLVWESVALSVWGMLWICDYLLLLTFASWRIARLLEKPPSHNVQYSLGTLMMVIFGAGLWISGLMSIFRP